MEKSLALHPFLFAGFPLLFLFAQNVDEVSYLDVGLPLTALSGLVLLAMLSSRWLFRDTVRTALILSSFLVLFFSYGHVYFVIEDWHSRLASHAVLLTAWGLLFAGSAIWTLQTQRDLLGTTRALNIVGLSLIAISLLNIGVYELTRASAGRDAGLPIEGNEEAASTALADAAAALPDIYYIVVDGYAASSVLKDVYEYDNQSFIDALTSRGFYVAPESRSNYALTFLSLASSLNMSHLESMAEALGTESTDRALPYQMIKNSEVSQYLQLKGYQFIHIRSGWGATARNRFADWDIHCGLGSEFLMVLMKTTMLNPLERHLPFTKGDARSNRLCAFSELAGLHSIDGPKFVFAHIVSPHPPYLFDANGEPVPEAELRMSGSVWGEREDYLNQLSFVSSKLETTVDEILTGSKSVPIIVLQADHGPASTFEVPDSGGWERPNAEMLRERMRIFNAYYLPSGGDRLLYDTITPVNTFRLIFDFYFNTTHELVDDRSYYSTETRPYAFVNVTDQVASH